MAEGLAALGAAAAVAQFVTMGFKLVEQGTELYRSVDGQTQSNREPDLVASNLQTVCEKLTLAHGQASAADGDDRVTELARQAEQVAREFRKEILDLNVTGNNRLITSCWKAWKGFWYQRKIQEYQGRLSKLKTQLTLDLVSLLSLGQERAEKHLQHVPHILKEIKLLKEDLKRSEASALTLPHDIEQRLLRLQTANEESQAVLNILQSLRYNDMFARESSLGDAHKDTFKWALQETPQPSNQNLQLASWLSSRDGIYWVTGLPGSGKSTLMKYICEAKKTHDLLRSWSGNHTLLVARHFFWIGGTENQRSEDGLLRSLLHEIFSERSEIVSRVVHPSRWEAQMRGLDTSMPWKVRELHDTLRRIAHMPTEDFKICLFIHGIDEYDGDHFDISQLFEDLCRSQHIKACLASRERSVFKDAFERNSANTLHVHEHTRSDISMYVTSAFAELQRKPWAGERGLKQMDLLVKTILDRAQGVFLWVTLVTESLRNGFSNGEPLERLQRRLEALPQKLEQLIERMFEMIDNDDRYELSIILRLVKLGQATNTRAWLPLIVLVFLDGWTDRSFVSRPSHETWSYSDLSKLCEICKRRLLSVCSGLVFIVDSEPSLGHEVPAKGPLLTTFKITHRAVFDFLGKTETKELMKPYYTPAFDRCEYTAQANLALLHQVDVCKIPKTTLENFLLFAFHNLDAPRGSSDLANAKRVVNFFSVLVQKLKDVKLVPEEELRIPDCNIREDQMIRAIETVEPLRASRYCVELLMYSNHRTYVCDMLEAGELDVNTWRGVNGAPLLALAQWKRLTHVLDTLFKCGGLPNNSQESKDMWLSLCKNICWPEHVDAAFANRRLALKGPELIWLQYGSTTSHPLRKRSFSIDIDV